MHLPLAHLADRPRSQPHAATTADQPAPHPTSPAKPVAAVPRTPPPPGYTPPPHPATRLIPQRQAAHFLPSPRPPNPHPPAHPPQSPPSHPRPTHQRTPSAADLSPAEERTDANTEYAAPCS